MNDQNRYKVIETLNELGVKQKELSEASGISKVVVNETLQGKRRFTPLFAVTIQTFTKDKIQARWIIERDRLDSLDEDLLQAKEELKGNLLSHLQDTEAKIKSLLS